jgi:PAS domain S-box-containing protein
MHTTPGDAAMDRATNEGDSLWGGRRSRLIAQPFAVAVSQSAIPTLMADLGEEGLPIVFVNDSFLRLAGRVEEELLGRGLASVLAEKDAAARIARDVAGGEVVSVDVRLTRTSGPDVWARLDSAPLFDPSGRASTVFVTVVDVDDRVRAEAGLVEAHRRFDERVAERTLSLESALKRSELMSREVTHRTKNALALLGAMIDVKRRRARSREEADILRDVAGRVRSIGTLQTLVGSLGAGREIVD